MTWQYLIALGSNMRHRRYGAPARVIEAAVAALDVNITARSPIIASRPLGPSLRTYANAVILIETRMSPPELLEHLQALEVHFGRKKRGQRWRARVLDLDIILWSGGIWAGQGLAIPHPAFRERRFVLSPASAIAARWRDPLTGFHLSHLKARLDRRRYPA